jgi:hypothetical protein
MAVVASTQPQSTIKSEDWQVAVGSALCWSAIYVGIVFSDNGQFNETLGPINGRIGDVASYALTLIPPALTCGLILATRGRTNSRVIKYGPLAGVLTAIGATVGFFLLFFAGGAQ